MLENEPDNNPSPANGDRPAAVTTPPRRRRAASRPAGPPAVPPAPATDEAPLEHAPATAQLDAPPVGPPPPVETQAEVPAPVSQQPTTAAAPESTTQPEVLASEVTEVAGSEESGSASATAKRAPAKRAPRKTAAKKAAAPEGDVSEPQPAESVVQEALATGPKKRAPRKRTTKKAPSDPAAESTAQPADESVDTATEPGPAIDLQPSAEGPAGWETPAAATVQPDESQVAQAESTAAEDVTDAEPAPGTAAAVDESRATAADDQQTSAESVSTDGPRDFGWLADPFAVPAAAPATPALPADTAAVTDLDAETSAAETTATETAPIENAPTETSASETTATEGDDDESGDGGNRRRRRRRGGRRRRRSGGDDEASDSDLDDDSDDTRTAAADRSAPAPGEASTADSGAQAGGPEAASDPNDDSADDGDGEDSEGQRRRRRRRRRRGEDGAGLPDDPSEVVVRVREPRSRKRPASNEVTGIEGSTRMEAKRQRRKEGRDAGRRRAPILSEAEFLARRESVNRKMIIRQREDSSTGSGGSLAQIAVLEDGILVEHYVDRDSAASLIGNVYLGRVQNVLPSMEAAFVDIGRGRNAVLYAGEVDWDSFGAEGHGRKVEKVLKSGQMILVQVSKDPVGAKGARLTNHVSIPGRYVVYAPGGHLSGISRKLPDVERRRLKDILADLVGESASVIVRTAAEGASEEELVRDVNRLKAQWEDIERKVKAGNSPQLLYGEPDLTVRIVRDLFTEDFSELIIQGNETMNDAYDAIQGYVTHVAPHLQERIHRWEPSGDDDDLFATYRLDEQIAKALERKVFLPSGGSLVIDRTEAMTVIDVNTGKFTGTGGNLEATVTSNNLEAAEEIVNQLRLRDIGGIIVIDFIDMVLPSNRELLLRRLVECLGRDRTRHQVAEVTSLGLVQMTRKKIGTGLLEAFGTECPHCLGRGFLLHDAPVDTQKQADGGTRESRGPNHRPRPGDGQRGPRPGGGRDSGAGRDNAARDNGARDKSGQDNGSRDSGTQDNGTQDNGTQDIGTRDSGSRDNGSRDHGSPEKEPVAVGVGASDSSSSGDDQPERGRSRRGRRGGRGASAGLDQDPSTQQPDDVADPTTVQPDPAGTAPGEPAAGQQESNRAYYDERERESENGQEEPTPSADVAPTTADVAGEESDHQDNGA